MAEAPDCRSLVLWSVPRGRNRAGVDHPAPRLGIGRGDMASSVPESTAPTAYQQGRLPAPTAPMPPAALNLPRELPPDLPPPAGRRRRARRRRGARLVRGRPARGGTA